MLISFFAGTRKKEYLFDQCVTSLRHKIEKLHHVVNYKMCTEA